MPRMLPSIATGRSTSPHLSQSMVRHVRSGYSRNKSNHMKTVTKTTKKHTIVAHGEKKNARCVFHAVNVCLVLEECTVSLSPCRHGDPPPLHFFDRYSKAEQGKLAPGTFIVRVPPFGPFGLLLHNQLFVGFVVRHGPQPPADSRPPTLIRGKQHRPQQFDDVVHLDKGVVQRHGRNADDVGFALVHDKVGLFHGPGPAVQEVVVSH